MFSSSIFFSRDATLIFRATIPAILLHDMVLYKFFFTATPVLLTHLILPGLVLGSLVCRAQRSRTPRAVAGTGEDLPENPAEMKVELLEEDMVILWLGYDSDE